MKNLKQIVQLVLFAPAVLLPPQLTTQQEKMQPEKVYYITKKTCRGAGTCPQTVGGLSKIWHSVFAALDIKIPAYQAVLGMVVVAVMFLVFGKSSARDDSEIAKHAQLPQTETHILAPATGINHIAEIDSQKIGRTVADDSLLMKFTVPVSGESI